MAQIIPKEQKSYNERLFQKGIRKQIHGARFFWLNETLKKLKVTTGTVLELGCFDGRSIEYLPFKPGKYVGYDANWEKGLDDGMERWKDFPQYRFVFCEKASDFNPDEKFDITLAMETLEHLPLNDLELYLQKIQQATSKYFLISVPMEKGLVLLLKHLSKKLFFEVDEPYTAKEIFYATFGNLKRVKRLEYGHKGFDYKELIRLLDKYFIIKEVTGLPFSFLPKSMNVTIGIVATPRQ